MTFWSDFWPSGRIWPFIFGNSSCIVSSISGSKCRLAPPTMLIFSIEWWLQFFAHYLQHSGPVLCGCAARSRTWNSTCRCYLHKRNNTRYHTRGRCDQPRLSHSQLLWTSTLLLSSLLRSGVCERVRIWWRSHSRCIRRSIRASLCPCCRLDCGELLRASIIISIKFIFILKIHRISLGASWTPFDLLEVFPLVRPNFINN